MRRTFRSASELLAGTPMSLIQHKRSTQLNDLPNISVVLAEALRAAGISTPQSLFEAGAQQSWCRLRARGNAPAGIHSLLALEGAILGLDWRSLPSDRRHALVRFASENLS